MATAHEHQIVAANPLIGLRRRGYMRQPEGAQEHERGR